MAPCKDEAGDIQLSNGTGEKHPLNAKAIMSDGEGEIPKACFTYTRV